MKWSCLELGRGLRRLGGRLLGLGIGSENGCSMGLLSFYILCGICHYIWEYLWWGILR